MKEKNLHLQISQYIHFVYPKIIFRTDFAAGMKMSIGQAMMNKRMQSESGYPDLFIAECRKGMGGLFLEIKNGRDKVYNKKGELLKNPHIQKQSEMLGRLRNAGYWATFVTSFDDAKEIIDEYLRG